MTFFLNNVKKLNEFTRVSRIEYFVDKSELIGKLNKLIDEIDRFVCVT